MDQLFIKNKGIANPDLQGLKSRSFGLHQDFINSYDSNIDRIKLLLFSTNNNLKTLTNLYVYKTENYNPSRFIDFFATS